MNKKTTYTSPIQTIDVMQYLVKHDFDVMALNKIQEELYLQFDTKDFNLAIDHNIAKCLLNYQDAIYKTYCFAKYGCGDTRKLKLDERKALSLKFKINAGSTDYIAEVRKVLDKMIEALPSEHRIWCVLLACLTFWGTVHSWLYFKNQEEKLKQESLIEAVQNNKLAIEKLAEIAKENTVARKAVEYVVTLEKDMAENLEKADTDVIINGETFTKKALSEIVADYRKKTKKEQIPTSHNITTRCTVKSIRLETPYKITLRNNENGEIIIAAYTPGFLNDKVFKHIKSAIEQGETPNFEFTINYFTDEKGKQTISIIDIKE